MRLKLKPPCFVTIADTGKIVALRQVSRPNAMLVRQGWKGLVARVQNKNGSGIIEYRKLRAAPPGTRGYLS